MSREIKFRAWSKSNEVMVDKVIVHHTNILHDSLSTLDPDLIFLQYTGLKDKNGKEIYEGDILFRMKPKMFQDSPTKPEYAIVEYKHDTFVGRYSDREEGSGNTGISAFLTVPTPFEVIGNIYENPSLLTKQ